MEAIDISLNQAYNKYLNTLNKIGFIKESEKDKLLIATFLVDLLNTNSIIPTEKEYDMIIKAYNKIASCSCLIPRIDASCVKHSINTRTLGRLRLYESSVIQFRESDVPKMTN